MFLNFTIFVFSVVKLTYYRPTNQHKLSLQTTRTILGVRVIRQNSIKRVDLFVWI